MHSRLDYVEPPYTITLSGVALVDAGEGRSINISGIRIAIADLARAGWTCRIKYSSHIVGCTRTTTHVTFNGSDNKSHITFKVKLSPHIYSPAQLLDVVGSYETGIVSVFPKSVAAPQTDMEVLESVERRIRSRLKAKKYKPRITLKQPVEAESEQLPWPMEFTRSALRVELALPERSHR